MYVRARARTKNLPRTHARSGVHDVCVVHVRKRMRFTTCDSTALVHLNGYLLFLKHFHAYKLKRYIVGARIIIVSVSLKLNYRNRVTPPTFRLLNNPELLPFSIAADACLMNSIVYCFQSI